MRAKKKNRFVSRFEKLSSFITRGSGSPGALITACLVIILWGITGPLFNFSDTWQLVINTGTTIVTFVMVFIIQHSQNKDTTAIHLKLNELIASNRSASNRLVSVEDLSEEELMTLKKFYTTLAKIATEDKEIFASHSIDEAQANSREKNRKFKTA